MALALTFTTALFGVACGEKEKAKEGAETTSSSLEEKIDFKKICEDMGIADSLYVKLGTDGSYCTIDTNPMDIDDYSSSLALGYIKDFNEKVDLPEYVYQEMVSTSYLQGKQTETSGDIEVTWYYHPDKGLNVTYKLVG